jgi:hypothetical protein
MVAASYELELCGEWFNVFEGQPRRLLESLHERPSRHLGVPKCTRKGTTQPPSEQGGQASDHLNWHAEHRLCH